MALNPRFAGLRWAADTTSPTPQQPLHTVELCTPPPTPNLTSPPQP